MNCFRLLLSILTCATTLRSAQTSAAASSEASTGDWLKEKGRIAAAAEAGRAAATARYDDAVAGWDRERTAMRREAGLRLH